MRQLRVKFIGEFITWSAAACAFGTPALDHEIRNNPMKNEPVIKRLSGLCSFRQ